ncbi:MAG: amine dehydrogenase large subunit [Myxococcota bacterium]|jgi:methylamine dehydrogenase heavy chain|nr:amine dehydrogenase large subunit [Myxococcota bacterium]
MRRQMIEVLSRDRTRRMFASWLAVTLLGLSASPPDVRANANVIDPEEIGHVATLSAPAPHWVWVPDRLLQHSLLYDGDSGSVLGMLDSPSMLTPRPPILSRKRSEFYSVDLDYDRGRRGTRIDYVSIYDIETLLPVGEITLPLKSAESNTGQGHVAMLDGEKFLLVFSQFPQSMTSVVDLEARKVVDQIATAGCAGLYPVGPLRFASLCGNGTVLLNVLDNEGRLHERIHSEPFFDVVQDPVFTVGDRMGASWVFVSFEGSVHQVDFATGKPVARSAWSVLNETDRDEGWRPGGLQHVAVHGASQQLFVVMHQGGAGTHKDAGSELWRFDLNDGSRSGRLEVPNLAAAFLGPLLEIQPDSIANTVLHWVVPNPGVHTIVISQDDDPLLFVRNAEMGAVGVIDPNTGEHLRTLKEAGLAGPTLGVH